MKLRKIIFCIVAFFAISPKQLSCSWMLVQETLKTKTNLPQSARAPFYAISVGFWVLLQAISLQMVEMGKKLQHYNPAMKKGFNDAVLDRVFTRLMIIRKIKAELEIKTGIKTTWHIMEESYFNAFALGSKTDALVSFTEAWLITDKLTNDQFERYLTAIMMHELGHVFHGHTSNRMISSTLQLIISNIILYHAEKSNSKNILQLQVAAVVLDILIPKLISRMNEYEADAFATTRTEGKNLKQGLEFISGEKGLLDLLSPVTGLLSTHPPTELRGKRVMKPNIAHKNVWTDPECYQWW